MKRFKHIELFLGSVLAMSLFFSCSNGDSDSGSDSGKNTDNQTKVEAGTDYNAPVGTQVYRMVTKRPNRSSAGSTVSVWYYDDKDALVYYSEEDTEYFDNTLTGEYSEGTVTSYTDEKKTDVFGKQVTIFGDTATGSGNYILDEDYDGNNKKISATIQVYELDEDAMVIYYYDCEYDPNATGNNVIKYREGTLDPLDYHEIIITEYYVKNLSWNAETLKVSGDLYPECQVVYLYDDEKTVDGGLFPQPLCVGYITTYIDYDLTKAPSEMIVLHKNYTKTEFRWNTSLYNEGPLEEISYNLEYDEESDSYKTIEQCGYKIIQVEEYDGKMLPIQEIWFTAEGNIQYKYTYDYDIEPLDELLSEDMIEKYGHSHYMTKKNYYQNSSTGLFLAESSEYLWYNVGDNKEYRYEVEIHKTYDKM